jgi:uncharacterized protein (DUF736 family)
MEIGAFTAREDGSFVGTVTTVFFTVPKVVIEPIAKTAPNQPDARLYSGDDVEFGAAWLRAARATGNPYYDILIDDITFAAPQWARLAPSKKQGRWILYWERKKASPDTNHA